MFHYAVCNVQFYTFSCKYSWKYCLVLSGYSLLCSFIVYIHSFRMTTTQVICQKRKAENGHYGILPALSPPVALCFVAFSEKINARSTSQAFQFLHFCPMFALYLLYWLPSLYIRKSSKVL